MKETRRRVNRGALTLPHGHASIARMSPALIAIDWGSSSFRGYLMSQGGEVLEETASGDGIGA